MGKGAKIVARLTLDSTKYNTEIARVERRAKQAAQQFQTIGREMSLSITAPLAIFSAASGKAYAEFDALTKALDSVGSAGAQTTERLKELRAIAKNPGLTFQEAIKGDVRLRAVGISAKQSARILREFGNAIAKSGGAGKELNTVTTQLGQLAAKGQVFAQDLKPIIEAAPAVASALSELYGSVDSESIQKALSSQGKGSAEFIEELLNKLEETGRVEGGFKNAMENMGDSLWIFLSNVGLAADESFNLTDKLNQLADSIANLGERFRELPEPVQKIIFGLGALLAGSGPALYIFGKLYRLSITLKKGFLLLIKPLQELGKWLVKISKSPIMPWIRKIFGLAVRLASRFFAIVTVINILRDSIRELINFGVNLINVFIDTEEVSKIIKSSWETASKAVSEEVDTLKTKFNEFVFFVKATWIKLTTEFEFGQKALANTIKGLGEGIVDSFELLKDPATWIGQNGALIEAVWTGASKRADENLEKLEEWRDQMIAGRLAILATEEAAFNTTIKNTKEQEKQTKKTTKAIVDDVKKKVKQIDPLTIIFGAGLTNVLKESSKVIDYVQKGLNQLEGKKLVDPENFDEVKEKADLFADAVRKAGQEGFVLDEAIVSTLRNMIGVVDKVQFDLPASWKIAIGTIEKLGLGKVFDQVEQGLLSIENKKFLFANGLVENFNEAEEKSNLLNSALSTMESNGIKFNDQLLQILKNMIGIGGEIDNNNNKLKEKIDLLNESFKLSSDFASAFGDIANGLAERDLQREEEKYQRERKRIEDTINNETIKNDKLAKLDEKYEKKKKQIARRQAITDKAVALFGAYINVALALTKSLDNPVMLPIIAALGAAQIAAIAAQPIPKFADGGIVYGDTLAQVGEYPGASSNPEVIAPLDKLKSLLGDGARQVYVTGRLDGADIYLSSQRGQSYYNRTR